MGQGMTKVLYYVLCFTTKTNSKKKKKKSKENKACSNPNQSF
jgi:hypothetical protein